LRSGSDSQELLQETIEQTQLPSFALVFTMCVEENVTSKAQFKQREQQQKLEAYESKLAKTIKIK
jgi:hypothetical protein